jgi:hypothetical protein
MGAERVGRWPDGRPGAEAIAIVALGGTLDVLSTVIGHSAVSGVEEWNIAVLTVATWVPFPLAVVLLKVWAVVIFAVGGVLVWRWDGPWELCLLGPGVLWTGVGVMNAATILSTL